MQRSIATVCLSGGIVEKLEAISAAGFDAFELFENDLVCFEGAPRDLAAIIGGLGLNLALYQPFRDFEAVPAALLARNLDRAERKFDVMGELGAPMMLVCSSVSPDAVNDDALAADQLAQLAERAGRRGLKIGYEALAWGRHVRHLDHAWRIVERAAHPHLGILLDSFHALAVGDDPAFIRTIPGEKIFFLQIADAPLMQLDALSWSRHYRCFPGQGQMDVAGFTRAALDAGYTGPLSLEVFNDEFRGGATRQIARDGYRSLLLLEEDVRRSPDAKPTTAVALFDPPQAPALGGLSFLEFAVDEEAAPLLGAWLEGCGFAFAGRHRSKAVTLYRAGGVNLVLNAEPDSFARSFWTMHGVSICAFGVRTGNAAAALGRATAYKSAQYEGRVGPNELTIPAVRAPDGSLLYFVDEALESHGLYEIEFDIGPGAGAVPATGIDHVAMALPTGHLDTWVLFYRAVLGLEAQDTYVLPDPHGLVRSKAVTDPGRTLRIPLNISIGRDTGAAHFVQRQVGAGVHHVALACDDIFHAAEVLAASGRLLTIPANYYGDLGARLGLDEAFVARLAKHNVLYDRIGDGEFLHVYTEVFEERFFLEYVHRIGGYDQYGAVNAAIRMAAHARLAKESAGA
jgi:4-hydroxyphenylpyruvate dioxygenase